MKYLVLCMLLLGCGVEIKTEQEILLEYCLNNFNKADLFLKEGDRRRFDLTECLVFSHDCIDKCSADPFESSACKLSAGKQDAKCRLVN